MSEIPQSPQPADPIPKLDYARPDPGRMVRVASYGTADEGELHAMELAASGIPVQVINANVNALGIPYTGLADVELHVHPEDVARAVHVLRPEAGDPLEPAEEPASAAGTVDEDGQPLAQVAAFDNVQELFEAHTLLASQFLRVFLPTLVPRGDQPPGEGKRFILRVEAEDLERAQALLREAYEEETDDEPRCPNCRSWRVYPDKHFWKDVASLVGMKEMPPAQMKCSACQFSGPAAAFMPGTSS